MTTKTKKVIGHAAQKAQRRGPITLGELVAAAFDAVGTEVRDVTKLLTSPEISCAIQRRIVLV